MRAPDCGQITRADVEDLASEANGDLPVAWNKAYVTLLEYAYDYDAAPKTAQRRKRDALQRALDRIVRCTESPADGVPPEWSSRARLEQGLGPVCWPTFCEFIYVDA